MLKSFVEKIESLVKADTIKIVKDEHGREYFTKDVYANKPSKPNSLNIHTLDGLVDLAKAEDLCCSAIICTPTKVSLVSSIEKKWQARTYYAEATAHQNTFPFRQHLEIEDFIIQVQCHFVNTTEKQKLINFVSSITSNDVMTSDDNGISQEVVTKNNIGRKEKTEMNPIITLRPDRTFAEIEQPEDLFLLRMHNNGNSLPTVSLRQAGGYAWEIEAINAIHEYLTERMPKHIPVIR